MQDLYVRLTRGVHLLPIYIYKQCSGMQGLCDRLTRGVYLLPLYIYKV